MFKNNAGFTLLEMLVVLLIISILIILFVPTLSNRSEDVQDKGCSALKKVVQAQVELYKMEKGNYPNALDELVDDYISEDQLKCQNGKDLVLKNGEVIAN
ncbi:MAG TPA: competence type IV pilus major pilin ComGC [Bacillota bacterium]|nr:competence type IV pilus major pilin ComGC [Bacillota bacterium]